MVYEFTLWGLSLSINLGYLGAWLTLSLLTALVLGRAIARANGRPAGGWWDAATSRPIDFGESALGRATASDSQRMATLDAEEEIQRAEARGRAVP